MPTEKQRTKLYFDLRQCNLSITTEDAVKAMMADDDLPMDDACDLVGYIDQLAKMRWAKDTGNYESLFAPKDMENTMTNLIDLTQRYKKTI